MRGPNSARNPLPELVSRRPRERVRDAPRHGGAGQNRAVAQEWPTHPASQVVRRAGTLVTRGLPGRARGDAPGKWVARLWVHKRVPPARRNTDTHPSGSPRSASAGKAGGQARRLWPAKSVMGVRPRARRSAKTSSAGQCRRHRGGHMTPGPNTLRGFSGASGNPQRLGPARCRSQRSVGRTRSAW
jgi:hypothetical protein